MYRNNFYKLKQILKRRVELYEKIMIVVDEHINYDNIEEYELFIYKFIIEIQNELININDLPLLFNFHMVQKNRLEKIKEMKKHNKEYKGISHTYIPECYKIK
jgi:hypothetical protein